MGNINDTIWITSRIRMIAERKAIRNQNISFLAVTYYSLFIVILSIFENFYKNPYPALSQINLAASVVVLVASLVSSGFRLEARAASFRECYLKLQRLYDQDLTDVEKLASYREILMDFPNHSPNDYKDLIVNHTIFERKKLSNHGERLRPNCLMIASYLVRRSLYFAMLILIFVSPVVFLLYPLLNMQS